MMQRRRWRCEMCPSYLQLDDSLACSGCVRAIRLRDIVKVQSHNLQTETWRQRGLGACSFHLWLPLGFVCQASKHPGFVDIHSLVWRL